MIRRVVIISFQIIVAIPTLAAILLALVGIGILSVLAGLHNEKS